MSIFENGGATVADVNFSSPELANLDVLFQRFLLQ